MSVKRYTKSRSRVMSCTRTWGRPRLWPCKERNLELGVATRHCLCPMPLFPTWVKYERRRSSQQDTLSPEVFNTLSTEHHLEFHVQHSAITPGTRRFKTGQSEVYKKRHFLKRLDITWRSTSENMSWYLMYKIVPPHSQPWNLAPSQPTP
jgi:hypothetical protein